MRLQEYINKYGLTDAKFGARIGAAQSHISRIRRGIIEPSLRTSLKINAATEGEVVLEDLLCRKKAATARKNSRSGKRTPTTRRPTRSHR